MIPASPSKASQTCWSAMLQLIHRLHFYAGLFIGPFILTAALSGTLYVMSPQIEKILYADLFTAVKDGTPQPLSSQVQAALNFMPESTIAAVRPSPAPGTTTRVMFASPELGPSETIAVFIDPVNLSIRGSETVYGTSGTLPFRTKIDYFHTNLLLGNIGRHYSEIAASWLWIVSLGGVAIWATAAFRNKGNSGSKLKRVHKFTGLLFITIFMFLSATGLTWSRWAGDNINTLRETFSWVTPPLKTSLTGITKPYIEDEHAEHRKQAASALSNNDKPEVYPALFYWIDETARKAGIDAALREIRPPKTADRAWVVAEIDRKWPTQVDSAAIDGTTFNVIDKVSFSDYGLIAKLTRWGIDAHMGILFGFTNQLIMAAAGLGLCVMTISGYVIWWRKRPCHWRAISPAQTLNYTFIHMPVAGKAIVVMIATVLGLSLPLLGVTLLIFIAIDQVRWRRAFHNRRD